MGCDIHLYVEFRPTHYTRIDGKYVELKAERWVSGDGFRLSSSDVDPTEDTVKEVCPGSDAFDDFYAHMEELRIPICENRDYGLFATLANVRNYARTEYICNPKGFPQDCCDFVNYEHQVWGKDCHSDSYLTLKELEDFYEKFGTIHYSGMVPAEDAYALKENGTTPQQWCQFTLLENWEYVEWDEENTSLERLIHILRDRADSLGVYGQNSAENIRIVFWFDN